MNTFVSGVIKSVESKPPDKTTSAKTDGRISYVWCNAN